MEFNKTEVAVIGELVSAANDVEVQELNDLQLAMIGGGAGDAVVQ